jgi:hypothetical protein
MPVPPQTAHLHFMVPLRPTARRLPTRPFHGLLPSLVPHQGILGGGLETLDQGEWSAFNPALPHLLNADRDQTNPVMQQLNGILASPSLFQFTSETPSCSPFGKRFTATVQKARKVIQRQQFSPFRQPEAKPIPPQPMEPQNSPGGGLYRIEGIEDLAGSVRKLGDLAALQEPQLKLPGRRVPSSYIDPGLCFDQLGGNAESFEHQGEFELRCGPSDHGLVRPRLRQHRGQPTNKAEAFSRLQSRLGA